jgi:hypothetical protein
MKEEVIKLLVQLDKEELIEIANCIRNYDMMTNKSKKDNLYIRYAAFRNYHSLSQFYEKNHTTKDSSLSNTLRGENDSLYNSVKLKRMLNIPNDLFMNYMEQTLRGEDNE